MKKGWWPIFLFNLLYIIIFAFYYIYIANYEFLFYISVIIFLFLFFIITINKTKFNNLLLWLLSFAGFLHMSGGGIWIKGENLYQLKILHIIGSGDSFVLRFDQISHIYGIFVITIIAYHFLTIYLSKERNSFFIYIVTFFIGIGWGSLVEIQEFVTVILFNRTGIGGYYNTLLDLIFNTIGAITAIIFLKIKNLKTI